MKVHGTILDAGNNGYWGPVTSLLDWCEINYQKSHFVAEFWNTVSNVSIIGFACLGLYQCIYLSLETRYFISLILFLLVGIGSAAFHGSLLYQKYILLYKP